jgi:hypothetical protein
VHILRWKNLRLPFNSLLKTVDLKFQNQTNVSTVRQAKKKKVNVVGSSTSTVISCNGVVSTLENNSITSSFDLQDNIYPEDKNISTNNDVKI